MKEIEEKKRKLESTLVSLQEKWGKQAVQRLEDSRREVSHVSTGFPSLDRTLGSGGLPKGRISEIIGRPTAGLSTIVLNIAKNAQTDGGMVLYFDHYKTFDPEYASLLGVNLNQLILLRPNDLHQSALILLDAVIIGGIGLIVIETRADKQIAEIWSPTLDKIIAPLGHSETIVLFLTHLPTLPWKALPSNAILSPENVSQSARNHQLKQQNKTMVSHYSAVRLFVQRSSWIIQGKELEGYKTQVKVNKNKFGPTGGNIDLNIPINYSNFI